MEAKGYINMTQPTTPAPWQDTLAEEGSRLLDAMREVTPTITEAVIRYVWATGVTGLVMAAIFAVVAVATLVAMTACAKKIKGNDDYVGGVIFFCVAGVSATVVAGVYFSANLPKVLAPEGAAVMMALKALGGQ